MDWKNILDKSDDLSELEGLERIDKRKQDSPNDAEWRIKDRDWLAALLMEKPQ